MKVYYSLPNISQTSMICFVYNDRSHKHLRLGQWWCLLMILHIVHSGYTYTATVKLSDPGKQYVPILMSAQLISTTLTDTVKQCITLCTNNVLCRIFDYGVSAPTQCRLFEGDTNTLGQIIPSLSPQSTAGVIQMTPDLFVEYGSPCSSSCSQSRYLQCESNFTCQCMPHTYWDPSTSMCMPQSPILGASCQQNKRMCREDLNYTCLQFNQCGPLAILLGTTMLDNATIIGGGATPGLSNPSGIGVFGTSADSLIVSDPGNDRVLVLWNIDTARQNISVVATEWASGQSLTLPRDLYIDVRNKTNLYLTEGMKDIVLLYSDIQDISSPPRIVAGIRNGSATGLQRLNNPAGVQVDKHYNVIIVSSNDHRIMFWPLNATSGIVIAGLGVPSSAPTGLNGPNGIALDEENGWLFVADSDNNRIQRYSLNDTWPCSGTTVAGGNGAGSGSHQLTSPADIRLSKKTGAMYIADRGNNRIQRWERGATQGVTVAGSPSGTSGNSANRLRFPGAVALNANETYLYVTDRSNDRIQRFQLI